MRPILSYLLSCFWVKTLQAWSWPCHQNATLEPNVHVSPSDDILLFVSPHLIKIKACGASNAIRIVLQIWKGSPDGKLLSEQIREEQGLFFRVFSDLLNSIRETLSFTEDYSQPLKSISFFWSICLLVLIITSYSCHQLLFSQCDQTSSNQSHLHGANRPRSPASLQERARIDCEVDWEFNVVLLIMVQMQTELLSLLIACCTLVY